MKKQYVKPAIFCEDYMHNPSISTACAIKKDPADYQPRWWYSPFDAEGVLDESCDYDKAEYPDTSPEWDFTIFVMETGCDRAFDEMVQPEDGFCYHTPEESNMIFAS